LINRHNISWLDFGFGKVAWWTLGPTLGLSFGFTKEAASSTLWDDNYAGKKRGLSWSKECSIADDYADNN
jgi:hypothetical protein